MSDKMTKEISKFRTLIAGGLNGARAVALKRRTIEENILNRREEALGYLVDAEAAQAEIEQLESELNKALSDGADTGKLFERITELKAKSSTYADMARRIEKHVLPGLKADLVEATRKLRSEAIPGIAAAREKAEAEVNARIDEVAVSLEAWREALRQVGREDLAVEDVDQFGSRALHLKENRTVRERL